MGRSCADDFHVATGPQARRVATGGHRARAESRRMVSIAPPPLPYSGVIEVALKAVGRRQVDPAPTEAAGATAVPMMVLVLVL